MITAENDRDRVRQVDATGLDVFDLEWETPGVSGLLRLEVDPTVMIARAGVVLEPSGQPLVALVAEDLPVPARGLEIRGPAVWLELVCETPLDHWTVGLEAFGVAIDDAEPITADTRGVVTPIGLDLDLDTVEPGPTSERGALRIPIRVHGEVLIGSGGHEIDGGGVRWRGGPDVPHDEGPVRSRRRLRLGCS